jgi:CagE, TrbE, VirB family, component of type IV transporter system
MLVAGDKALSQSEELTRAADELLSRKWVLGDHSLVLIAFADSKRAMVEVGNAAWRDLAACGLVATEDRGRDPRPASVTRSKGRIYPVFQGARIGGPGPAL